MCSNSSEHSSTFCHFLETYDVSKNPKIRVYCVRDNGIAADPVPIDVWPELVQAARSAANTTVQAKRYVGSTARKEFDRDMKMMERIRHAPKMLDYTPFTSFFHWKEHLVVGLVLDDRHYFSFSSRCETRLQNLLHPDRMATFAAEQELPGLLHDLLASLALLQTNNLYHGAVCPAHICVQDGPTPAGVKYILGDWDTLQNLTWKELSKNVPVSTPLHLYMTTPSILTKVTGVAARIAATCMGTKDHPLFEVEFESFVQDLVQTWYQDAAQARGALSLEDFFDRWKYTADLFPVGLMVYAIARFYSLPPLYTQFALDLCNPFRPTSHIQDATQALREWDRRVQETATDSPVPPLDPPATATKTDVAPCAESLCRHWVGPDDWTDVEWYDARGQRIQDRRPTPAELWAWLQKQKQHPRFVLQEIEDSAQFLRELENRPTVDAIYAHAKQKHLLALDLPAVKGVTFAGLVFHTATGPIYTTWSARCQHTVDRIPLTPSVWSNLLQDIPRSLQVLHKAKMIHGDVHAKNIWLCPQQANDPVRFRLTGFGHVVSIASWNPDLPLGGSSPLAFYLGLRRRKIPAVIAVQSTIEYFARRDTHDLWSDAMAPRFTPFWKREIVPAFKKLVQSRASDAELFETYGCTLDTYALGLTLLKLWLEQPQSVPYAAIICWIRRLVRFEMPTIMSHPPPALVV